MNAPSDTISLSALRSITAADRAQLALDAAAIRALGDEAERLAFSDVAAALEATLVVMEMADRCGDAGARARARRARAQSLAYSGQHEAALAACADAEQVALAGGAVVEAARAKLASLHPLGETGRYADAIAVGEAARAALLDAGEPSLAARADINLGAIYQNQDDPARALTHLERARRALTAEPNLLAFVENNRGEALLSLSDFDGAEEAFIAARTAADEAGAAVVAAVAEGNLADLAARRGLLARSMSHFERARRRLRDVAAESHAARLQAEHAEALESLGIVEDAAALFEEALPELERHGLTAEYARALHGLAICQMRRGQTAEAQRSLDGSRAGLAALGATLAVTRVDLTRAELLTDARLFDEADAVLDHLAADDDRPFERVVASFRRSRLALGRGDAAQAERFATEAISGAIALGLAPLEADALHARSGARRALGRPEAAFSDLRAAALKLEPMRGALQAERFRASVVGRRSGLYDDLVAAAVDSGAAPAQVFWAVEQAKGRALLDLAARAIDAASDDQSGPEDAALTRSAARLRAELNALYSRRADALLREGHSSSISQTREAISLRETELFRAEARLAAARGPSSLYAAPSTLEQVQAALSDGEALIEYFQHDDRIGAIVVDRRQAHVLAGVADAGQVARFAQRVRFQLNSAARAVASGRTPDDAIQVTLSQIFDALLAAPIKAAGAARSLLIVPRGALHTLPLHACHDGAGWLMERFEIAYAPSASLFAQLRTRPTRHASGAVVIGVADELAPHIEQEARAVAAMAPGARTLVGAEATVAATSDALRGAKWAHFGCHGAFSPDRPQGSGLKLADGWLTPREIARLGLDAELVVLSACSSGETTVEAGDELTGLARSFFAAGAQSVVASLWPAHDDATRELMNVFYRKLCSGCSRSGALRAAQRAMLITYPHPLYWGTFVLVGSP